MACPIENIGAILLSADPIDLDRIKTQYLKAPVAFFDRYTAHAGHWNTFLFTLEKCPLRSVIFCMEVGLYNPTCFGIWMGSMQNFGRDLEIFDCVLGFDIVKSTWGAAQSMQIERFAWAGYRCRPIQIFRKHFPTLRVKVSLEIAAQTCACDCCLESVYIPCASVESAIDLTRTLIRYKKEEVADKVIAWMRTECSTFTYKISTAELMLFWYMPKYSKAIYSIPFTFPSPKEIVELASKYTGEFRVTFLIEFLERTGLSIAIGDFQGFNSRQILDLHFKHPNQITLPLNDYIRILPRSPEIFFKERRPEIFQVKGVLGSILNSVNQWQLFPLRDRQIASIAAAFIAHNPAAIYNKMKIRRKAMFKATESIAWGVIRRYMDKVLSAYVALLLEKHFIYDSELIKTIVSFAF